MELCGIVWGCLESVELCGVVSSNLCQRVCVCQRVGISVCVFVCVCLCVVRACVYVCQNVWLYVPCVFVSVCFSACVYVSVFV